MKLRKLFYLLLALPLVFAACESESDDVNKTPEYKAELKLTSEATMEVAAEAGDYEITYTAKMVEVTREAAPATVSAECAADWVTIGEVTDAKAAFSVAANDGEARETKVVVKYDTESFEVAVKQAAKAVVEPQPVTVTALGFGGYYVSGAEEELDVDNYFFVLTDKAFTEEGDMPDGAVVYCVDLYLEAYEGEWKEFMPLPVGEYTLSEQEYVAGTFFKEGSVYLADSSTDDIVQFEAGKLVVTETGLTLTVTIAGVEHTVTYEGAMTLVNDSEEPTKPVEATVIEVAHAFVTYYGDQYNPGVADNFGVIFSSVAMQSDDDLWKPSTKYYRFDLYTALVDATEDLAIPYGTYKLDMNETYAVGTVDYAYSKYFMIDSYGSDYEEVEFYDDATVTVSESGIVAEFVIGEENFKLVFEGSTVFVDSSPSDSVDEPVSTLTEDVVLNITGATLQFEDFGDYYYNGTNNYVVYIHEDIDGGTGAYIMFDLLTAGNAANIAGEYTLADNEQAYTAFTGYFDTWDEECYGAWYIDMDTSAMAPIVGGKFTVAIADDGTYTFTLDCADDAENTITGTIFGKPEGADEGGNEGGNEDVAGKFVPTRVEIKKPYTSDEYHYFYDDAGNQMVVNWCNGKIWDSDTDWIPVGGEASGRDWNYAATFDYTHNGNDSITYNNVNITFFDGTVIEFSNLTFTYTVLQ